MPTPTRAGLSAEPNVTPMIDVLLVLLVIFMLIVPQVRRLIAAQLPQPVMDDAPGVPAIVVEAVAHERYAIDGADAELTRKALISRLAALHASSPAAPVFVRGAEGARYDDVFGAMDAARGAGVSRVALSPKGEGVSARK